ncbi:MAG: AAA family ATPase [Clostridiales Family XIII bacterium]|jgi:predicted ATPase|nr:AAA family ATPase [Clostridiales Family XIII bacterium]
MGLFRNGAVWVRGDFHLHTRADREFVYDGSDNSYLAEYVAALEAADIRVGVVSNHNKFDFEEFKALRKAAKKKDIFLLPGVELSVNDGANGIHTIIVFSDEWLENGQDYISQFLHTAFEGKMPQDYENENGRCGFGLNDTIKKLEAYTGKDFFLVFAHVEQGGGLWNELDGGRLLELGQSAPFRRRALGFQKVRTYDSKGKSQKSVKGWLKDAYPAELEGSDPKAAGQIGKGKACYLKLGAFTFEAVKFALIDHEARVRLESIPQCGHSYIRQISFEGGTLDGRQICFSPELNTFIGIRGSGKSSVLEAMRYALGIRIDDGDADKGYKEKLVERTLGSGGKVVVDAVDRHGQPYAIQRIWKENPNVLFGGRLQQGVSIRETVLHKPLFFGQKELAAAKNSEKDLIEKLLGTKCDAVRREISRQKAAVTEAADKLAKAENVGELIEEQKKIKQDALFRLNFYKEHNLEEKLRKRLGFADDMRRAEKGIAIVDAFASDLRGLIAAHEDELRNFGGYTSANNVELFGRFDGQFAKAVDSIETIKGELGRLEAVRTALNAELGILETERGKLSDEFAAAERKLSEELSAADGKNISSDEFLALKSKIAQADALLGNLSKTDAQKGLLRQGLNNELQRLNELWHEEFKIIKGELDKVSEKNAALKFSVAFKEGKLEFVDYFAAIFKGSGIRATVFQRLAEDYQDFAAIYNDFENAKALVGGSLGAFADFFEKNLKALLTYQTPNKFEITYRGVALERHSLGQRASALILFVLGQRENDVIIIDQPEDDLDNQTIYLDVIKLILELKPEAQFIFATHNPNIPVLGDAEQIHACSSENGKIAVQSGGLDDPGQQKMVVDIMEGGKEAFDRRKEIYQIWT